MTRSNQRIQNALCKPSLTGVKQFSSDPRPNTDLLTGAYTVCPLAVSAAQRHNQSIAGSFGATNAQPGNLKVLRLASRPP